MINARIAVPPAPPKGIQGMAHDAHYSALDIEPLEIMQADFTAEEYKGFLKGNILKYLLRNKEPKKDVDKLVSYAKLLQEHVSCTSD